MCHPDRLSLVKDGRLEDERTHDDLLERSDQIRRLCRDYLSQTERRLNVEARGGERWRQ